MYRVPFVLLALATVLTALGCSDPETTTPQVILNFDPPPAQYACWVSFGDRDSFALADAVDPNPEEALFGDDQNDSTNLYSHAYVLNRSYGGELTLTLSRRTVSEAIAEPFVLGLRFYDPLFDPDNPPTETELRNYFFVGREFPVGLGEGATRFGILLPTDETAGVNRRSRTDLLSEPVGTVRVTLVEDYRVFSALSPDGNATYSYVTFEYDLDVGLYSARQDALAGPALYDFVAKERARVRGTATLYMAAE